MRFHSLFLVVSWLLPCLLWAPGLLWAQTPPAEVVNSIGMKLVLIPAGTFQMGSRPTEEGAHADEVLHEVRLTRPFYLGAYEVTQSQYRQVMGKNPSNFVPGMVRVSDTSNFPVENITWKDAVRFCRKLSELPDEKEAGRVYRLPTEAEWEYASRAGTQTAFHFGDDFGSLADYGHFQIDQERETHAVGTKKPNPWGLFDMYGNVWEFCADHHAPRYAEESVVDPRGPEQGTERVARGGSYLSKPNHCRSAARQACNPDQVFDDCGFRIVLEISDR
jgi:formylglycine-generating enzyme required for sulfatase activity